MKLEKNGRSSCGQKSRHIDIRFFFMKDRVGTERMDIRYCPTEQMLADFFTKPLQGSLFKRFKRVIMGLDHVSVLWREESNLTEERVGNDIKPGNQRASGKAYISSRPVVAFRPDSRTSNRTFSSVVRGNPYTGQKND